MPHDFEDLNLAHHPCNVRLVLDLILFKDFYGNFFIGQHVGAQPHFAKSTLPNRFSFAERVNKGPNDLPTR